MIWIQEHWQTIAALAVVGVTVLLFLRNLLGREKTSCGGQCECPTRAMGGKEEHSE